MKKVHTLEELIELLKDANERNVALDVERDIGDDLDDDFYKWKGKKRLLGVLCSEFDRALDSENNELRYDATHLIWEINNEHPNSLFLPLVLKCLLEKDKTDEKKVKEIAFFTLNTLLDELPLKDVEKSVEKLTELDPEEFVSIKLQAFPEEDYEFGPYIEFLEKCKNEEMLSHYFSWLLKIFHDSGTEIDFVFDDDALNIENPLFAKIVETYIDSDDYYKRAYSLAYLQYHEDERTIQIANRNLSDIVVEKEGDAKGNKFHAWDQFAWATMNILQKDADLSSLKPLLEFNEKLDKRLSEIKRSECAEALYTFKYELIPNSLYSIMESSPKQFKDLILPFMKTELGGWVRDLPIEYTFPLLIKKSFNEFIDDWDPGKYYGSDESIDVSGYLQIYGVNDDEKYAVVYDKDCTIEEKYVSNPKGPENGYEIKDISQWHYGLKSDSLILPVNTRKNICDRIKALLKFLGIIEGSGRALHFLIFQDGNIFRGGEEAAKIIRKRHELIIAKITKTRNASLHECAEFLSQLRHYVDEASTKSHKKIDAINKSIINPAKPKEFRVEECNRDIRIGAFGCSKEEGACIFPGGAMDRKFIDIFKNKSITFLDYYTRIKGYDTEEKKVVEGDARVNRGILGKCIIMDKFEELEKCEPVLLVDSIQGMIGGLPFEYQYNGIVDFAEDREYDYILYNDKASNAHAIGFTDFVREKMSEKDDLEKVEVNIKLLDSNTSIYTDAWHVYKSPYGNVSGYLKALA